MDGWRYEVHTLTHDGQTAVYLIRRTKHRDPDATPRVQVIQQHATVDADGGIIWHQDPDGTVMNPLVIV